MTLETPHSIAIEPSKIKTIEAIVLNSHMARGYISRCVLGGYRNVERYEPWQRLEMLKRHFPALIRQFPGSQRLYIENEGSDVIFPTLIDPRRDSFFGPFFKMYSYIGLNPSHDFTAIYPRTIVNMSPRELFEGENDTRLSNSEILEGNGSLWQNNGKVKKLGYVHFSRPLLLDYGRPPKVSMEHPVSRYQSGRKKGHAVALDNNEVEELIKHLVRCYPNYFFRLD